MKKRLFISAFILLLATAIRAQVPYYDALTLSTYLDQTGTKHIFKKDVVNQNAVFTLLSAYVPGQGTDASAIYGQLNPVLQGFFDPGPGGKANVFTVTALLPANTSVSSGGFSTTAVINAVADLMIERAKEELTVSFFNRLKAYLAKYPECQVLFPKTEQTLYNLMSYSYTQILPAMQASFMQDIDQLPATLPQVLTMPRYQSFLARFPEVAVAVRSLQLIQSLSIQNINIADAIKTLAAYPEWTSQPTNAGMINIGCCIKMAAIISESIRLDAAHANGQQIWVSGDDLAKMVQNPDEFQLYIGLIIQQAIQQPIQYFDNSTGKLQPLANLLNPVAKQALVMQTSFQSLFNVTSQFNQQFSDLANQQGTETKLSAADFANYLTQSLTVLNTASNLVSGLTGMKINNSYSSLLRSSCDLVQDIGNKQYTQAINDAFDLLSLVDTLSGRQVDLASVKKNLTSYSGTGASDVKELASSHWFLSPLQQSSVDAVTALQSTNKDVSDLAAYYNLHSLATFAEKIKPYALFVANVADAKTSADITTALDNAILPVGSSSLKKDTRFNISVQSYLGANLNLYNYSSQATGTWSDKVGVTAPIGISITPNWGSWRGGGSLSAFVSLFDIGAVVDYRLKNDSTVSASGKSTPSISKSYSLTLSQVVSPGFYMVYGFFDNLPLALGGGLQYGPGLSKIQQSGTPVLNNPSWRFNLFLAMDLPFFTIKNTVKPGN